MKLLILFSIPLFSWAKSGFKAYSAKVVAAQDAIILKATK